MYVYHFEWKCKDRIGINMKAQTILYIIVQNGIYIREDYLLVPDIYDICIRRPFVFGPPFFCSVFFFVLRLRCVRFCCFLRACLEGEKTSRWPGGSWGWPLYTGVDGAFRFDGSSIFDLARTANTVVDRAGLTTVVPGTFFSSTLAICRFDVVYDLF